MTERCNTAPYVIGTALAFIGLASIWYLWTVVSISSLTPLWGIALLIGMTGTAFGGLVVAVLAGSEIAACPYHWWRFSWSIAAIAGLIDGANATIYYAAPYHLVLYRDIAASVFFVVSITMIVAGLGRCLVHRGIRADLRRNVCVIVAFAFALALPTPILSLLIHCTSNDCI